MPKNHDLYLLGFNEKSGQRYPTALAIKGLRKMFDLAGLPELASLDAVQKLLDTFAHHGSPFFLLTDPDLATLEQFKVEAEKHSGGVLRLVIDFEPGDEIDEPSQDTDEDAGLLSEGAYETAIVLMHAQGGNPSAAMLLAAMLSHSTGDEDTYGEVIQAIIKSIPVVQQQPFG